MAAGYVSRGLHIGVGRPPPLSFATPGRRNNTLRLEQASWSALNDIMETYVRDSVAEMQAICSEHRIPSERPLLESQARRSDVEGAFRAAVEAIGSTGLLVMSFAGHGMYIEDDGNDELDGCDTAWVLWDGELTDDDLRDWLHGIPSSCQVVIVSDCCYAGGIGTSAGAAKEPLCVQNPGARPRPIPPLRHTYIGSVEKGFPWIPVGGEQPFTARLREQLLRPRPAGCYRELERRLIEVSSANARPRISCHPDAVWGMRPFTRP